MPAYRDVNYDSSAPLTAGQLVELLRAQDGRFDQKFDAAHAQNLGRLDGIETRLGGVENKQAIANGSVGKLQAAVSVLESKEREREDTVIRTTIEERARHSALQGVWVIPKIGWMRWSVIGAVVGFLGYDGIMAFIRVVIRMVVLWRGMH